MSRRLRLTPRRKDWTARGAISHLALSSTLYMGICLTVAGVARFKQRVEHGPDSLAIPAPAVVDVIAVGVGGLLIFAVLFVYAWRADRRAEQRPRRPRRSSSVDYTPALRALVLIALAVAVIVPAVAVSLGWKP